MIWSYCGTHKYATIFASPGMYFSRFSYIHELQVHQQSTSVRNLGVIFDDQLTFKVHIAKIRPFLTEHAAQLLVQALVISRLDYCNALLAGLPSNTIKPLQMIQNAAARLVFNEPMLHLSLSPCTGYQLQLASSSRHWCLHIEQPQAQHTPTSTHYYELTSPPEAPPTSTHYYESTSPPEVWDLLVSDASWYHHREAQNHFPEHSLSLFLAGGMTPPHPDSWIPVNLQATTENSSLSTLLDFILKKKCFLFIFLSLSC